MGLLMYKTQGVPLMFRAKGLCMSKPTTVIKAWHLLAAQPAMFRSVKATVPFSDSLQTLLLVCSVAGQVVAVCLAFHRKAQETAQLEAAV